MQTLLRHFADWGIVLMDKFKLKWRVFTFLLGFCGLLIVILWFFQTVLLNDMYKYIRKMEIEKAIALVEKNIDSPNLNAIISDLKAEQEILVMRTHEFSLPIKQKEPNPKRPKQETLTQVKKFRLSDGNAISLTFYAMITPVEATVSTLQLQLYIITALMVLFSIALAIIIARRISKPIEDLNKSAKILASGSYNAHFAGRGFLEIKELSDTLNVAASELSKVEDLRHELMANISHDLRTPLALIYSYSEMMHDFPDEITPEQTQIIMDETKRLTSLVNDVLDVSRLETGTMELKNTTYNLTASLNETIARMAELVKKDGYNLMFEYSEEIYVKADEIKIMQAFYNLLINAIHYATKDKDILIRQSTFEGKVKIEVIDHGYGIAPENLPHIWVTKLLQQI